MISSFPWRWSPSEATPAAAALAVTLCYCCGRGLQRRPGKGPQFVAYISMLQHFPRLFFWGGGVLLDSHYTGTALY